MKTIKYYEGKLASARLTEAETKRVHRYAEILVEKAEKELADAIAEAKVVSAP